MAITASGLYIPTWRDVLDATQLALDLDLDTHRGALFTNSVANPNFSTDTAYGVAPYNANEIPAGGGYATGGELLLGTTFTESPAGSLMWDATDLAWAASTITNARGCLLYADVLAGNNAICLVNFGADYSTVAGTFTIQWNALGIIAIDITP